MLTIKLRTATTLNTSQPIKWGCRYENCKLLSKLIEIKLVGKYKPSYNTLNQPTASAGTYDNLNLFQEQPLLKASGRNMPS